MELKEDNTKLSEQLRNSQKNLEEKQSAFAIVEKINSSLNEQKAKLLTQLDESTQAIVDKDQKITTLVSQIGTLFYTSYF